MQRKQGSHPRSHLPRLVLILLLFAVVLAVAGLFSCTFQPVVATRGTMLFLPGL